MIDPGDFGVYGGHFDLDTSSQWYAFAAGDTDGHVHEWDDKWNRTTVDLFDLPDAGTLFNIQDIVASGDRLMLTVGNTALSSAAVGPGVTMGGSGRAERAQSRPGMGIS